MSDVNFSKVNGNVKGFVSISSFCDWLQKKTCSGFCDIKSEKLEKCQRI